MPRSRNENYEAEESFLMYAKVVCKTKVKKVQMRRKTGRKYTQSKEYSKEKQLVFVALVRKTNFPIR